MMLMPAAALIVVILGAIAVDRAIIFGAQRELIAVAQAAANDAASLGVDIDALRSDGEIVPDLDAIDEAVQLASLSAEPGTTVAWSLQGDVIEIRMERDVDLLFTAGVPGASDIETITATATAELRVSDP